MRLVVFFAAVATTIVSSFGEQPASSVYKGMTVSCQTWGIEWQMPEMEATLDELKSLGVNSIAIHPYAQIREDGHVAAGRRSGASTTHITTPLRWAHERGMAAMVIPHIAYWGTKFSWRGEINFATPEEWDRFFTDYETWIVQMATLAQAEHAEIFCVGLEFTYPQKYDERWRKIIAAVRAVYHGKVTYGANWNEYADVKFWNALDYIGVLAYFPLTKTTDPSAAEISTAWEGFRPCSPSRDGVRSRSHTESANIHGDESTCSTFEARTRTRARTASTGVEAEKTSTSQRNASF